MSTKAGRESRVWYGHRPNADKAHILVSWSIAIVAIAIRKDGHAVAQPSLIILHDVRHRLISVVVVLKVLVVVVRIGHLVDELAEEVGESCTVFGFELLEALDVAFDDLGLGLEVVADLLGVVVGSGTGLSNRSRRRASALSAS